MPWAAFILNRGQQGLKCLLEFEIFVDKSELLDVTNRYVENTQQVYVCPVRAFWKVNGNRYAGSLLWLRGWYRELFEETFHQSVCKSYENILNQYDVLSED